MFTPVKVVRASEDVFEQIKQAIFSGKLAPGDRLPPERELVREFGLSRVTIREAIRKLEAAGFVRVKTGANGGAFVTEATPGIVADSLTTLLRLQKATLRELSEARKIVETAIVEMAALRADEDDIAAMQEAVEHTRNAIAQNRPHAPASLEFHTALAKAAKNRVLLSTIESFHVPLNEALEKIGLTPEGPALALEYHQKICDAIRRRDSVTARRLMEIHLQQFQERLQQVLEAEAIEGSNGPLNDQDL